MNKRAETCDCTVIHGNLVDKVRWQMPVHDRLLTLASFFKVFGDKTRIQILWALDLSELCVCDLAALFGMTKSAISHQLKYLRSAELVKTRREGKVVYYSLKDDHVKDIIEKGYEHILEKNNGEES